MEIKKDFQLDEESLFNYLLLQQNLANDSASSSIYDTSNTMPGQFAKMHVQQFHGGQSNPTYLLTLFRGNRNDIAPFQCVLRKQPPGKLLPGAHQVIREARMIQALAAHAPVPKILLICEDTSVIGTSFFIMEYLDGVIYRYPTMEGVSADTRKAVFAAAIHFLAQLHSINVSALALPAGLHSSAGKGGFCKKQVQLWFAQHQKSCLISGDEFPTLNQVAAWLDTHVPAGDVDGSYSGAGARVTHGDFRIDNIVFSREEPGRILGVLDWELSALGDPAVDLAYFCLPHYFPPVSLLKPFSLRASDTPIPGIPCERRIVQWYMGDTAPSSSSAHIQVGTERWVFYLSLGLFRMACIASGIHARATKGNAVGQQAGVLKAAIPLLADTALRLINTCTAQSSTGMLTPRTFPLCSRGAELLRKLRIFNDEYAIPAESEVMQYYSTSDGVWPERGTRWRRHEKIAALIGQARAMGLWNCWMTASLAAALKREFPAWDWSALLPHGEGLSHVSYMYLAVESGRCVLTPLSINCSAPDTGNMEVIALFGTRPQKARYLLPLLEGTARSCFGMTEPGLSSSDPTQLQSTATKFTPAVGTLHADEEDDDRKNNSSSSTAWVLNGRKWWTTGACDELCTVCVFVARSADSRSSASQHQRHTLFLVPFDAPGITVVRPLHVFGYDDAPHGHAEVHFDGVVVDEREGVLGEVGAGFAQIQARLGPGRLHHCARLIGHGERAIEEVLARGAARRAFGKSLLELGANSEKLARSRIAVDRSLLLVLNAASELDAFHSAAAVEAAVGNRVGHKILPALYASLAVVKADVPSSIQGCLDFAVQIHGGGGLTYDHALAAMWTACRVLRLVDGPDEVHLMTLAKLETQRSKMSQDQARGSREVAFASDVRGSGQAASSFAHVNSPGTGQARL